MENNTITIIEVENHINKWFGSKWDNQSSAQVYAMVIDLLAKVGTEVLPEEPTIYPVNSQGLRYVNEEIGYVDQDEEYY